MSLVLKRVCNIFLVLFFLSIHVSCAQSEMGYILGEWTVNQNSDGGDWDPLVFVFRSDNKYFVYNDLDFNGSPYVESDFNIFLDNGTVTTLIETGIWSLNTGSNKVELSARNFIKPSSMLNEIIGKGEKLQLKFIQDSLKIMQVCNDIGNSCIKLFHNYTPDFQFKEVYYSEKHINKNGYGMDTKTIFISGLERILILKYNFFEEADQIVIKDFSDQVIFSTEMTPTMESINEKISIIGKTKLVIQIISSKKESKWNYDLIIK